MRPPLTSEGHNGHGAGAPVDPEAVQAALDKILASPGFSSAERLTRFLSFTVSETLAGNADRLKESMLGVEVFGRKPTYDPRMDAVVRTEAVKLRARLREYYETAGRDDALRIDLPKGGYVPQFVPREPAVTDAAATLPAPPAAVPTTPGAAAASNGRKPLLAGALVVLALAAVVFYSQRDHSAPNQIALIVHNPVHVALPGQPASPPAL